MAANINFYARLQNNPINNLSGSGLGFFGAGFNYSVDVGAYQQTTFITNGNGTSQGPQVDNIQYMNVGSGVINSASSGVPLTCIPNYLATLNISFTNSTAVKTQNAQLIIYDRVNINNPASGVSTKVAQIIHPDVVQNNNGSGDTTWNGTSVNPQTGTLTVGGSGIVVNLVGSPGTSGLSPNGPATVDTQHDWYVAISASPDSIGSKTQFGLFIELEYL